MADSQDAQVGKPGAAATSDLNRPLFVALIAHTVTVNAVVALARVTTSYRAIELDLSVVWLGVIASGFSLIPVFSAVWVGRLIDRGYDALSARVGAAMMLVACAGLWWMPNSAVHLLLFSIVLGFGHLFCMAGHQMIAVRCAGPISREHVFGYHMIAIAIGQGLGPMMLSWLGGDAHLPPTQLLFTAALVGAMISQVVAFGLRRTGAPAAARGRTETVTVRDMLRQRSLVAVLIASVVTVTAFELLTVYLPLLGTERQIDTRDIGLLLATRSLVSIVSRTFYARLIMLVGRQRLMLACMMLGAAGFTLMGLPVPLPLMYVAMAVVGVGLGIAATLGFSEVVALAPRHARATALSLRLTGNRIGQLLVPAAASVVAEITGIGGVLLIIAACLAASGAFTHISVKRP